MYSRNFAKFEKVNPQRLEKYQTNVNTIGSDKSSTVPVKSYSDTSAIEAFNKLGEPEINEEAENTDVTYDKSANNDDKDSNTEQKNGLTVENKENTFSIIKNFHKLVDIIDDDLFIIILAVSILIFGRNETNDKLTPIALLAIMFL